MALPKQFSALFLALVVLVSIAPRSALAASATQECQFDLQLDLSEDPPKKTAANWVVVLTRTNHDGQVNVEGSGTYQARAHRSKQDGRRYSFQTRSSEETITISPDGNALWDIRFKTGEPLVYLGHCNQEKVQN